MKSVIETFKDIPGYEGLYQVSDYGAVRSLKYGKVRYLKNVKQPNGYEIINLCRDGKPKKFRIHRLVWEAFVGPIPEGMEIDHINTIRDDNRLDNLRVATPKENCNNPITAERHRDSMRRMSNDPQWRESVREASKQRSKKSMENKLKIQRRIKAYMALNGIKNKVLAELLNVTPSNLTQLLSDGNDLRLSSIQRIAEVLGTDIKEFFK